MNNTKLTDAVYATAAKKLACAFNLMHEATIKQNKVSSKLSKKILDKTISYIPVIMELTDFVTDVAEPNEGQEWVNTVVKGAYLYASGLAQGAAKKLPSDIVVSMVEAYWEVEFGHIKTEIKISHLSEHQLCEVKKNAAIKSKQYLRKNNELFFGVAVIANSYLEADDWATVTVRAIFAEYVSKEIQRFAQPAK